VAAPAARDPGTPHTHPLARDRSRTRPMGAVCVTVMCPPRPLFHTWLFVAAAMGGKGGGVFGPNLLRGALGSAVPVGGRRNRESPETRTLGGPMPTNPPPREPGPLACQASAWRAGSPRSQRGGGPPGNGFTPMRGRQPFPGDGMGLSGGSRDSKWVVVVVRLWG